MFFYFDRVVAIKKISNNNMFFMSVISLFITTSFNKTVSSIECNNIG